jgi:multidrug resistance efflux pump
MVETGVAHVLAKPARSLDAGARRKLQRRQLFILFGALLAIGAATWGGWWLWVGQRYISIDDAYVGADSAEITSWPWRSRRPMIAVSWPCQS